MVPARAEPPERGAWRRSHPLSPEWPAAAPVFAVSIRDRRYADKGSVVWYPEKWWTEEVDKHHLKECTDEELEEFLQQSRALSINLFPEPDDLDIPTVAGFVS